ncbi:MAG: site-2 protease family protein [Clostridia bacterium]|nr:site-2 protease family protein [Clostridia bacterium]
MLDTMISTLGEPIAFFESAFFRMAAVLIGLCCHEWGHAYAAYLCGDNTAKRRGRLTLNPLRHLDPIGTVLMLFAGFGYAKPVPVDPRNFKGNRVRCDFLVSIAGIVVNLILCVLFTAAAAFASLAMWAPDVIAYSGLSVLLDYNYVAVWSIISGTAAEEFGALLAMPWLLPVVRLCAYTALVNMNLAVFNLLPIPPLDGYHVVNDLIFKGRFHLSEKAFRICMLVVMVLAWRGILGSIISAVVYPLQQLILLPIRFIWG